jgi:guanine nucleotide-binding protein subunit alpha
MGNCVSDGQDKAGKARSDAIDKQLEEESKRFKKECKILLLGAFFHQFLTFVVFSFLMGYLGSGESGKSTIVKQMKIIHQSGFTQEELASYRPIVYKNVVDSAQSLVNAMSLLGKEWVNPQNKVRSSFFPFYPRTTSPF